MTERGRFTPQSVAQAAERAVEAVSLPQSPPEEDRRVEKNFDVLRTHIDGLFLLVDHDESAETLTRNDTERMNELGGPYVARAVTIKRLTELQTKPHEGATKSPHDELEGFGINHGVRGARNEKAGWEVQFNPSREDVFSESLLDASLGDREPDAVHKKVKFTVELDPDKDDVKGFLRSMQARLRRQGSTAQIKTDRTFRVDEKTLLEMIESGEVILANGAWETRIKDWSIVPRVISSEADRQAVEQVFETEEAPEDNSN